MRTTMGNTFYAAAAALTSEPTTCTATASHGTRKGARAENAYATDKGPFTGARISGTSSRQRSDVRK
jgi:hypothetical protein